MIRETIANETKRALDLFWQTFNEKVDLKDYDSEVYNIDSIKGDLGFEVKINNNEFYIFTNKYFTDLEIYIHILDKKVEGVKFNYEDGLEGHGNSKEGWHLTTHNIAFQYDLEESKIIPNIDRFVVNTINGFLTDVSYI